MSNLIFSLNSTLPIFIVIIIGYVLGQKKFLTKEFCSVADKLVFRVGLPAMLFCDMTSIDLTENFNGLGLGLCLAHLFVQRNGLGDLLAHLHHWI